MASQESGLTPGISRSPVSPNSMKSFGSAFDWSGEHLHRFLIHGAAYGIPHLGDVGFHCSEPFRTLKHLMPARFL